MSQGAKSHTIQIDSATAEKVNDEHYKLSLSPSIDVPYLAKPRAQLESLAFTNSFGNLDGTDLKNNILKLGWYSHAVGDATPPKWQTTDVTLDSGQYDIAMLEQSIAKKIKSLSHTPTFGTDLWTTMDTYCSANAGYNASDPSTGNVVTFQTMGVIVTGNGAWADAVDDQSLGAGKMILPIRLEQTPAGTETNETSLNLYRENVDGSPLYIDQPPNWLIGSTLTSAISVPFDNPASTDAKAAMHLTTGDTIIAVHKLKSGSKIKDKSNKDFALHADWGIELHHAAAASPVTTTVYINGNDHITVDATFTPPGAGNANFRGYAVRGLAQPSLKPSSGWGSALDVHEIEAIANATGTIANNTAIGTVDTLTENVPQSQRYMKPVSFDADVATNKLRAYFAWPGVYVLKGSTLFTHMLGYSDDDLMRNPIDLAPSGTEIAKQNPFANATSLTVAAPKDRKMIESSSEVHIQRVRSIIFNCPSLIPPSYGPDGHLSLAQMASVPVLVGASQVQSYQASHDDSVPCQLHGSCVSSIEFFITDQSGTKIDMQGSSFQATLRLFYPDPIHPQIGTADAEMDDAVGLRDVMFR